VGAGVSGIGAGIALRKAGFHDFRILERAQDVGGTWRDHTYPGLTVDAPSLIYSFSYAQKPDWSSVWATQSEVHGYLRSLVRSFGLRSHLRFGADVASADFDAGRKTWLVRCTDGTEIRSRYLINASGYLNVPKTPDIDGLDSFTGTVIHTSRWRSDLDLTHSRVAMIGTGATVFQRTPIWLLPKPPLVFTPTVQKVFSRVPGAQRLARLATAAFMDLVFFRVFTNYRQVAWLARLVERLAKRHICAQVHTPSIQDALTPRYNWGCKRPSFSNDFYPIFNRDNVTLETNPIDRATHDGLVTADGAHHPVDVIVCATGYQPFEKSSLPTYPIRGIDGAELREFWDQNRYQAFRGFAVPGFPNFFLVMGPYSIAGSSYYSMVEVAMRNILTCMKAARSRGASLVEVTPEANSKDLAQVLDSKRTSIWRTADCGGSRTYYLDRFGDTPAFRPSYSYREWWASRTLAMSDFRFEP
jgi:cation diffusion facilitator CzcD-associated flavoprotein CzcO